MTRQMPVDGALRLEVNKMFEAHREDMVGFFEGSVPELEEVELKAYVLRAWYAQMAVGDSGAAPEDFAVVMDLGLMCWRELARRAVN